VNPVFGRPSFDHHFYRHIEWSFRRRSLDHKKTVRQLIYLPSIITKNNTIVFGLGRQNGLALLPF
jgi:hypothetical protein